MTSPPSVGSCPRCNRVLELDEHGRMHGHWDLGNFSTDECPGAAIYNRSATMTDERHHEPPRHERGDDEMPWWAELLLRQLVDLRADQHAARRLERATREALAAVATLTNDAGPSS